jgi:hypothetical protein
MPVNVVVVDTEDLPRAAPGAPPAYRLFVRAHGDVTRSFEIPHGIVTKLSLTRHGRPDRPE